MPVMILGFFKVVGVDDLPFCVVETFEYEHSKFSVWGTKWKKCMGSNGPQIQVVSCDSLVSPCLMIPWNKDQSYYEHIWDRNFWADECFKC